MDTDEIFGTKLREKNLEENMDWRFCFMGAVKREESENIFGINCGEKVLPRERVNRPSVL